MKGSKYNIRYKQVKSLFIKLTKFMELLQILAFINLQVNIYFSELRKKNRKHCKSKFYATLFYRIISSF